MRVPVFNQKGGGGKTATVVNLGAALARQKKAALLIDLDPNRLSATHGGVWARLIKVDSICGKGPSVLKRQMARHYVLASYDRRRNMSSEILDRMRRSSAATCASR